jgi:ParB-like chromosome segregation protein Spo0J
MTNYIEMAEFIASKLLCLDMPQRIEALNRVRQIIATASPFQAEPVDCVLWIPAEEVKSNDYNPNSVAPPEMELLRLSILSDGYTQPIVAWENEGYEVIDGFHRHRVGKELPDVNARIHNHLPLAVIKEDREGRNDRIASTIRHNRARGKHRVDSMSEIVLELKRRNWSPKKIGTELGMDQDEVLRLVQISGLAEMFKDSEFSEAWEVDKTEGDDFEKID